MAFPQPRPQAPQLPRHLLRTVDCQQGAVRAVRFNADGNYLVTCGSDKTLRLWSVSRGVQLKSYSGHGYEVLDADGSFDNSQLCSCSSDKTVILWDVATGQVTRKLRGHAGVGVTRADGGAERGGLLQLAKIVRVRDLSWSSSDIPVSPRKSAAFLSVSLQRVNCVRFNEEATVMLSGSIDGTVRCWDTRSRRMEPIQVLDEARDGVSSLKVSEHELLTGSVDGRVRRYDLRMGQLHVDFIGSPITCVCFSQDGQCTLSSSLDSTVRLLDKSTGELLGDYTGHQNKDYKLECCLSHKDTHVLSCSEDGCVYFWDLVEGSLTLKLPVGKAVVQSLSFHPTEPRLLTAMEGRVQVWGVELEETEVDNEQ